MSDAPTNATFDIERAQVTALLKRLQGGTPLTEQQQKQVSEYLAAEKLKNETPTTGKRGRKPKAIVPRGSNFTTMRGAQLALVAEAKGRIENGKPLANHHARALRDAWLMEDAVHIWPTLIAAAADLKISVTTLRNMGEEGCPLEPHSPIAKAPVLTWLLERAHERGGNRGVTGANLEAVDLQWRQAKLNKLNESLVAQAEDRAHQGVVAVMAAVRHHLQSALPGSLVDLVDACKGDRNTAEEKVIKLIESELLRIEPPKPKTTTEATQ